MTPTRDELIGLRFDQKMTREKIAEHYNVSVPTVRRWIKELDVPRPTRAATTPRPAHITASGGLVEQIQEGDGYTRLEKAKMNLEGRLVERIGYGYYVDGKLVDVDSVLKAAKV